jgi:pimeloyl-ACP methyl ester carboxylesterase
MSPGILLLHGGMDDGSSWARVASRLTPRFRVVRPHRLQYRLDLKRGRACTMAEEVSYVRELLEPVDGPLVVVGHSSGAVLALEMLVALPAGLFAGAVIYEPPLVTSALPLGGEALVRARAAVARGRSGKALAIFLREIVRIPAWAAWLAGVAVPVVPTLRRYAPHQIDDCAAIEALGDRLSAYAEIAVPTVLLGGEHSPAHLGERLDALERALPDTERVLMRGQGHAATRTAPDRVAEVVTALADRVLR